MRLVAMTREAGATEEERAAAYDPEAAGEKYFPILGNHCWSGNCRFSKETMVNGKASRATALHTDLFVLCFLRGGEVCHTRSGPPGSSITHVTGQRLNQVQIWFARIEREVIARGVFTSVKDLSRKLMRYSRAYSKVARLCRWKYTNLQRRIHSC